MSEILPTTYDQPKQPTILEGIEKISKFIGFDDAEKMRKEYLDGQRTIATADTLLVEVARLRQERQALDFKIQSNEQRSHALASLLGAIASRRAEMEVFIAGFAKFTSSEKTTGTTEVVDALSADDEAATETRKIQRVDLRDIVVTPPRPMVAPKVRRYEESSVMEEQENAPNSTAQPDASVLSSESVGWAPTGDRSTKRRETSHFGNFNNIDPQRPVGKAALMQVIAAKTPLLGNHKH